MPPVEMPVAQAECPMCDVLSPELDSDGRPYTCYTCGDSGRVPKSFADAYWRSCEDQAEYPKLRPVVDGKHRGWACDEYETWAIESPLLPRELFAKAREPVVLEPCADDLPF